MGRTKRHSNNRPQDGACLWKGRDTHGEHGMTSDRHAALVPRNQPGTLFQLFFWRFPFNSFSLLPGSLHGMSWRRHLFGQALLT